MPIGRRLIKGMYRHPKFEGGTTQYAFNHIKLEDKQTRVWKLMALNLVGFEQLSDF